MPTVLTAKGRPRVDAGALASLLRELAGALPGAMPSIDHAIVESVSARPGQGVTSMFAFGQAVGIVWGVLGAFGVPTTAVTPAAWKSALRVPAAKHGARVRASQLLPGSASMWPLAKNDGRAEAALIGLWYVKINQNEIDW
jgi:hypothetical protein